MNSQTRVKPCWAAFMVWATVNTINVLQAVGFFSRVMTGSRLLNHFLGYGIIMLSLPAAIAVVAFIKAKAGWRQWIGPALFIAFIVFMVAVDYILRVEFRSPIRSGILVPYLVLFFGSIFFMGLPMFHMKRRLWLVTVATTILLLISMVYAISIGVG